MYVVLSIGWHVEMSHASPTWAQGMDLAALFYRADMLRENPDARYLRTHDSTGCGTFCSDGHMTHNLAQLASQGGTPPFAEQAILVFHD